MSDKHVTEEDREVLRQIRGHIEAFGIDSFVMICCLACCACMVVGLVAGAALGFLYVVTTAGG